MRGRVAAFFLRPLDDTTAGLDAMAQARRPTRALVAMVLAVVATWFVYVPIHEFLHVLGCLGTGGSVSELQISPAYGGALFAEIFPFVVAGGDYAGRLSGFDTHGSDLVYLATVFAPYLLSVAAVPVLRRTHARPRPVLFGATVVVALAPFYNVQGDFFELGSILATAPWSGDGDSPFLALRSDDLFLRASELANDPASLGLEEHQLAAWALMAVGMLLSLGLAFATYAVGSALAARLAARRPLESAC